MKIITTALALGALIAVPAAYAQDDAFLAADIDADGEVTLEEATAAIPDLAEEDFTAADADQSGALSDSEFAGLEAPGATMEEEGATEEGAAEESN